MQPNHSKRRHEVGFTLVEIMVVVAIMGLLATMVVRSVMDSAEEARDGRIQTDLTTIADAAKMYHLHKGELPSMEALMTPDANDRVYVDDPSLDPWQQPYHIREGDSKRTFLVVCTGKDMVLDTDDDIQKRARL